MPEYTLQELNEALRAIHSIIHKCEKAQDKFPEGNSHHTLLRNRLRAMYLSKALIEEKLSEEESVTVAQAEMCDPALLLANLEKLHTTKLGAERIKRNLHLAAEDVTLWCKEKIKSAGTTIARRGKNWYICVDSCEITVNAHSYTIITAHEQSGA